MNTKRSLRKFAFPLLLALLLCLPLAHAAAASYPESDHPYAANSDVTWSYTHDTAADYLAITFSADSTLESGWDYLYLTDEAGQEQSFTGSLANKTVRIAGDSFTLRLTSDVSVQYYGFAISSIKAISEEEYATPVFTVSDGILTGVNGGKAGATLTIPKTVDGQTITAIGSYALQGCTFGKVILPNTVTSIGSYAFSQSTSLTSVTLPSGLTTISNYAFYNCTSLTVPAIPSSVTTIGNYAFYGCKCEGDVTLPDNITSIGYGYLPNGTYPFVTKDSQTETALRNASLSFRWSSQPDFAFTSSNGDLYLARYLGSAGSVVIPSGICGISSSAFADNTTITSVTLPSTLTSIGYQAFYGCTNLTIPTIPSGVTSIDHYAFLGCRDDSTVTLPDNITSVGSSFLPSNIHPIVTKGSRTETTLRNASLSFRWSSSPDFVYKVSNENLLLVKYLGSASSVTVPSGIHSISSSAFASNTSITSVTLPSTLTSIGSSAFEYCSNLVIPTIPASVTEIGSWAFSGCRSDSTVTLPDHITSVGYNFLPYDVYPIVTKGSVTESTLLNSGRNFRRSSAPDYVLRYDTYEEKLCLYDYVGSASTVSIPSDVQELSSSVFKNNTSITTVTLPKSLTSIPDYTFQGCTALTKVTLPNTITRIGRDAFEGCTSLASITLPTSLTIIGYGAFEDCSSLNIPAIPASVTEIGGYAFHDCTSSSDVILPDNITSIGYGFLPYDVYPIVTKGSVTESTMLASDMFFRRSTEPDFVLYYSSYDEELRLGYYIGDDASVTVPNGIQRVSSYAFEGNATITSVVLPDSIVGLYDYTFANCPNLTSITLPNSITTLPDSFLVDPDLIITVHQDSPLLPLLIEHGHPYKIIETGEVFNVVNSNATTASQKVNDIVAAVIRPDMTDYQKALALHNWLMTNCYYDETYTHYSGEYMLLHGTGVCQSYAEAYRMLLNKVGIPNCLEHGNNHVWNMIQLDGDWYHVDVTWDDPIGGGTGNERWDFFCLSNYALEGVDNHECYNKPHVGTAYKYNYAYRNGLLDERLDEVESLIISNLQSGLLEFSFTPGSFNYTYPYGINNRTAALVIQDTTYFVNGTRANLSISYDDATMTFTVKAKMSTPDFTLPAALKKVETEAFAGSGASVVWLPDGITSIGAKAFADCANLYQIRIPASVTSISDTAFENVDGLCIFAPSGSTAESFAKTHGYSFCAED